MHIIVLPVVCIHSSRSIINPSLRIFSRTPPRMLPWLYLCVSHHLCFNNIVVHPRWEIKHGGIPIMVRYINISIVFVLLPEQRRRQLQNIINTIRCFSGKFSARPCHPSRHHPQNTRTDTEVWFAAWDRSKYLIIYIDYIYMSTYRPSFRGKVVTQRHEEFVIFFPSCYYLS